MYANISIYYMYAIYEWDVLYVCVYAILYVHAYSIIYSHTLYCSMRHRKVELAVKKSFECLGNWSHGFPCRLAGLSLRCTTGREDNSWIRFMLPGISHGVCGNVNEVLMVEERHRGWRQSRGMDLFGDFVQRNGLMDVLIAGSRFTCSNLQADPAMSKLDRFLC